MSNYQPSFLDENDAPPITWDDITPPDEDFNDMPDWATSPMFPGDAAEIEVPDTSEAELAAMQLGINFGSEDVEAANQLALSLGELFAGASDPIVEIEDAELVWNPLGNALEDDPLLQAELANRADALNLSDGRFLGKMELDQAGDPVGYTVQALECYTDPTTGEMSGSVLDVGHYVDMEQAEQVYFMLQGGVGDVVPIYAVGAMAEQAALSNGLPVEWREATSDDLALYQSQLDINPASDIPPDGADIMPFVLTALETAGIDPLLAAQQQEFLETQQAIEALKAIGLQPSSDFTLNRDTFFDERTGDRLLNGIFQQNPDDPAASCQATLIALSNTATGLQAYASEFGPVGSLEEVAPAWNTVQTALYEHGPEGAIEAIEGIEATIVRESPEEAIEIMPPDVLFDMQTGYSGPSHDIEL